MEMEKIIVKVKVIVVAVINKVDTAICSKYKTPCTIHMEEEDIIRFLNHTIVSILMLPHIYILYSKPTHIFQHISHMKEMDTTHLLTKDVFLSKSVLLDILLHLEVGLMDMGVVRMEED